MIEMNFDQSKHEKFVSTVSRIILVSIFATAASWIFFDVNKPLVYTTIGIVVIAFLSKFFLIKIDRVIIIDNSEVRYFSRGKLKTCIPFNRIQKIVNVASSQINGECHIIKGSGKKIQVSSLYTNYDQFKKFLSEEGFSELVVEKKY